MNDFFDNKHEDIVKDMNLEAKVDKELLLHGFLRSDFSMASSAERANALCNASRVKITNSLTSLMRLNIKGPHE